MPENITFIGTGSGFSSLPNTNLLLTFRNCRIIIDIGFTGLTQLNRLKIGITTIDGMIITHMHSDHIGGIEMFTYINKFRHNRKVLLILPYFEFKFMLWDTLKASMQFSKYGAMGMSDYFTTIIASRNGQSLNATYKGHKFIFIKTKHIPGMLSYGIVFSMNGKRIFYTSDSIFDPELLLKINKKYALSYIIHDARTMDTEDGVHATYKELSNLPDRLKNKTLLIHYDDNFKDFEPKKDGFIGFAVTGEKFIP